MNIEETKRAIEVMQAFVDGKMTQVSVKNECCWCVMSLTPTWNWMEMDYRIAPEPEHIQIIRRLIGIANYHGRDMDVNLAEDYLKREGY